MKSEPVYTEKTYPLAKFHVADGWYTIAELEKFLETAKKTKEWQARMLARSMEVVK